MGLSVHWMISHLTTSHHLANLTAEVMYTENIIVVNYQSDRRCSKLSCANLLLSINVSKESWGLLGPRRTLKADIFGLLPNSGSYRGIFQHPKLPIFFDPTSDTGGKNESTSDIPKSARHSTFLPPCIFSVEWIRVTRHYHDYIFHYFISLHNSRSQDYKNLRSNHILRITW